MKPKLYIYSQPNYLTSRTAIEVLHAVRQSRTSSQIIFAVCLSKKQALTGGKSLAREDKCSKKIGAVLVQQADRRSFEASAVPILVCFYILCNNKSYKEPSGFLRAEPLSSYFEDRKGYREGKKLLSDKSVFPSLTYHLQSAQFITNAKGEQYEHIEYTPYGELWTYKSKTAMLFLTTYNNFLAKQPAGLIEETAPGIDKLPFRFTGKELDEETGLYYYGARYLDPKYSRWLSGDPALNDYIPKAGADTSKLPNGGAYNCFNFAVFGYGNNNPIKYNDPTGETASYSIDDENKTITINVEIIIFGKDATSEIAQIYEKGIMDAWGGEWTANYNGEEYKVSINANVKLGKRPNIFQKIWNFFFGTKNYVNVENRERAYVVFGFYGNWRAVGRGTRTLSQDNPAGHEFGHLLGFDDRYDYNTQNPKPGWEGNIMAEATYKPSIVEQRDINRMVDYISNQKIFGYQRKHGNIRPWRMLY